MVVVVEKSIAGSGVVGVAPSVPVLMDLNGDTGFAIRTLLGPA